MSFFFDSEIEGDFVDSIAEEHQGLQGFKARYFIRKDNAFRTEGIRNETPKEGIPDFDPTFADVEPVYGEPYDIIDEDEFGPVVAESWGFSEPFELTLVVTSATRDESPDDKGLIVVREFEGWVARAETDRLGFTPRPGDVVEAFGANDPAFHGFFDVEDQTGATSRFGGDGFHIMHELNLKRRDSFVAERKDPIEEEIEE